jgi:membrane-associated phospholipid phosphatase
MVFLGIGIALRGGVAVGVVRDGVPVIDRPADPGLAVLRVWNMQATQAIRTVLAPQGTNPTLQVLDSFGELPLWWLVVSAGAVWLWIKGNRQAVLLLVATQLSVEGVSTISKVVLHPWGTYVHGLEELKQVFALGEYPSAHLARITVSLSLFVALVTRWRARLSLPAVVLASTYVLVVAMARLTAEAHLLSGVVGGCLLGASWAAIALECSAWVSRCRRGPQPSVLRR